MSEPFLGEIKLLSFGFAPKGWAFCDGQHLPIAQNQALFSLLGTTFGGNGVTTFALPDLRGRAPMQPGQGPGLSQRSLGDADGADGIVLTTAQIPVRSHTLRGSLEDDDSTLPGGNYYGQLSTTYNPASALNAMALGSLLPSGTNQPHNNMMPYLTLNFCIALQGLFPPSS